MFFWDEALFQGIYHVQIHSVKELALLTVEIEIRIGFADEILNRRAVRVGHGLIHQSEASLTIFGKNKVWINIDHLPEEFSLLLQLPLRSFGLGDVNGSTDVADEIAIGLKARHSMIQHPTIFAIISPQTVFHRELSPHVEGVDVDLKTAVKILRVNSLCPAISKLLLQGPAGKVEPSLVQKGAGLARIRHPDHHRRRIGHGVKASLALPQRFVGTFALRDIKGHPTQAKRVAPPVKLDAPARRNPTDRTVVQNHSILGDIVAAVLQRPEHRLARRFTVVRMQSMDEPLEVDRFGFGPAEQPTTLGRDPGLIASSVPHPQPETGRVCRQTYTLFALMERLLSSLALANIKHKAAKFDWFSIPMLASDDVMDPDSLPGRGNHAIFKFKIFGALTESQTSADCEFLIVRMEMGDPEIFFIPLFDRIAEEPGSLWAHISENPALDIGLPWNRRSGFNQATEILLALAPGFLCGPTRQRVGKDRPEQTRPLQKLWQDLTLVPNCFETQHSNHLFPSHHRNAIGRPYVVFLISGAIDVRFWRQRLEVWQTNVTAGH